MTEQPKTQEVRLRTLQLVHRVDCESRFFNESYIRCLYQRKTLPRTETVAEGILEYMDPSLLNVRHIHGKKLDDELSDLAPSRIKTMTNGGVEKAILNLRTP
jgi:hypothetical protein